jgi:hypothetical protein
VVETFKISAHWSAQEAVPCEPIDATFCALRLVINDQNVTSYSTSIGGEEDHVEIPAYYLSEWIAENWWPLLWEPRKTEDSDAEDRDYRFRHSIRTAEHGFALPNLSITPTGDVIQLFAKPREAQYADARFRAYVDFPAEREHVERQLSAFVDGTVERLAGCVGTPLQVAWKAIKETDQESVEFCRLMGALGLSPYDANPSIEAAIDSASRILTACQLLDLCLSSTPENVVKAAFAAATMRRAAESSPDIDLSSLPPAPQDQVGGYAWRHGYKAAQSLRRHFGISEHDIDGASIVFEKIGVVTDTNNHFSFQNSDLPISGETEKRGHAGKLILASSAKPTRRFAAARATFFFQTGESEDFRLITNAVTRDQQASRAFAAELLVPQSYLRQRAIGSRLSWDMITKIADDAVVSPEVVKLQATNCGLTFSAQ